MNRRTSTSTASGSFIHSLLLIKHRGELSHFHPFAINLILICRTGKNIVCSAITTCASPSTDFHHFFLSLHEIEIGKCVYAKITFRRLPHTYLSNSLQLNQHPFSTNKAIIIAHNLQLTIAIQFHR